MNIKTIVVVLLLWLALVWGFVQWFAIPVVTMSTETLKCKEVWSETGKHDCDNLPEKYEILWGK